jgi:hypothetical protein
MKILLLASVEWGSGHRKSGLATAFVRFEINTRETAQHSAKPCDSLSKMGAAEVSRIISGTWRFCKTG